MHLCCLANYALQPAYGNLRLPMLCLQHTAHPCMLHAHLQGKDKGGKAAAEEGSHAGGGDQGGGSHCQEAEDVDQLVQALNLKTVRCHLFFAYCEGCDKQSDLQLSPCLHVWRQISCQGDEGRQHVFSIGWGDLLTCRMRSCHAVQLVHSTVIKLCHVQQPHFCTFPRLNALSFMNPQI